MRTFNSPTDRRSQSAPARPIVWSIAASDSGGGAGIQADTLTIQDLGGHACNIVTAITAQNSVEVTAITATAVDMLTHQLSCLLTDMPPQAIKVGVLANGAQVRLLANWLAGTLALYQQKYDINIPVIWDPVMLASTGQELTAHNDSPTLDDYLLLAKKVSLVTPNGQELMYLTGTTVKPETQKSWQYLSKILAQAIKTQVLLTGGDNHPSLATDWLVAHKIADTSMQHQHQLIGFCHSKIITLHNHGSGCTFSSAIATSMALGYPLLDAITVAKAYVNQGLRQGYAPGKGAGVLARCGWPNALMYFPQIVLCDYPSLAADQNLSFAMIETPLQVYPVTQSLWVLEAVLKAGTRTAQFRMKDPSNIEELEQQVQQAIVLGRRYQGQVFINDHWQLAIKHGAFGVHLGQEDMLQANLKHIAQAGLALGLSSHGYFELLLAQQLHPSYLAIGHIFVTPTKTMPSQPQGLTKLSRYCALLKSHIPLVAIGGINEDNLTQLHATQVDTVAIVRAIEQAEDPGLSWQKLQHQWQNFA